MKTLYRFIFKLLWHIFDFTGLRYIYQMIFPLPLTLNQSKRPPSSFLIWFIGLYGVIYGLSLQFYEMKVNRIERRLNSIATVLTTNSFRSALQRIPSTQHMSCSVKPVFFNPIVTFQSFLGKQKLSNDDIDLLKEMVFTGTVRGTVAHSI